MKVLVSILIFVTLVASASSLYFRASTSRVGGELEEVRREARQLQNELTAAEIRAGGKAGAVSQDGVPEEVLRSRIAELEEQLEEYEAGVAALKQEVAAAPEPEEPVVEDEAAREERRQRSREEWEQRRQERMAELREQDPQEYARMVQERQEFKRRTTDHVGGQVGLFAALNTEGLPQEYVDNHVALVEKLSEFQARVDAINADPAAASSGRRELFGSIRELAPMLEMEREVALNDFALELGYEPSEASSFVEYVDYVNEMTSPRSLMQNMGGFGGDRGGRGGGDRGGRGGGGGR